jgi:hypothetical protein
MSNDYPWADIGTCTEWAAEARIPTWDGDRSDFPQPPRLLHVGHRHVEAPDSAGGFVRLMAQVMVDRSAADGACTEQHLGAAGFTAAEITLYADRARERARQHTATRDGTAAGRHQVQQLKPVRPVFRVPARSEHHHA